MEEMKRRLIDAVAAKLSAAPPSADKDELIEELSDNLYRRFLDMNGAGVPEEEAFTRALDDLGDVDELLAYLGVEPEPDVVINDGDSQTRIRTENGQTRITTKDGQRIIINGTDDDNIIIINTGEAEEAQEEADAAQEEAGTAQDGTETAEGPQPRQDEHGDVHYDYSTGIPQSDLDAILANVSEICNTAVEQAKDAIRQAKEAVKRRTTVEKDNSHVRVHFNSNPDAPTPPTPPSSDGWEFEAELDSDAGRFFAGAGPRQKKDTIYGFGYDKAKGGFFSQWGEWKGGDGQGRGPTFHGEDSYMEHQDDDSYSVTSLKDLRGIQVQTNAGDVSIHVSEAPDAGVIIDGDVDDLDVTCSADGVLTIREGRTASSSFFSRRGFNAADVELYLPRRHWESIRVATASGDVDIDRDGLDVDTLSVQTSSGDLSVRLSACAQLNFKSASGDLEVEGPCACLYAETMSGDVSLEGRLDDAVVKTASGDIELEGLVCRFQGSSLSGDVSVETSVPPQAMELSSKSGDCRARIPDAGPFTVRMKTVTGEMDCGFRINYINSTCVYGDGSGPAYSMTTVSGDVSLERY